MSLEKDSTFSWHLLTSVVTVGWADSVRCADAEETVTREPDLVGVPVVGGAVTAAGERAILNTGTHAESVEWFRGCNPDDDSAEPVSVGTGRTYVVGPDAVGQRIQAVIDYRDAVTGSGVTWETTATRPPWSGRSPRSPRPRSSPGPL